MSGAKKVPEPPLTPRQAYDKARAEVQKLHSYRSSGFGVGGDCNACKQDYLDIGAHVEALAEAAGQVALRKRVHELAVEHEKQEIEAAKKVAEEIRKNPGGLQT